MGEELQDALTQYVATITGESPWIEVVDRELISKLPLFLREKYRMFRTDLFGRRLFLALQNRSTTELSPTEYAQDAATLRKLLSADVALVIADARSYVRNRMVRQHVPFIVPGTQMFLPMLMIDLREQYPRRRGQSKRFLSAVAQLIVIYHLVRESLNEIPLGQIALRLGYSAMSVSKAHDELRHANLCEVVRSGKTVLLHFNGSKAQVWRNAEHLLTTPVKRTQWIRWGHPRPNALTAGTTALGAYTMLADDAVPTFAMRDRDIVAALKRGEIVACAGSEDAQARLEAWRYEPRVLSNDGKRVDPCSLYLSLRRSADERVQKELNSLVNGFLE